jgi:hypothetical protein
MSGESMSDSASLSAAIMRGAVAMSSSPRTDSSSYPSFRLRSTTSGVTAEASLIAPPSSGAGTVVTCT